MAGQQERGASAFTERLYRRLGSSYLWWFRGFCLLFAAFLCVLATWLFSVYQEMSAAEFARVALIALGLNLAVLAWGIQASLRPLAPLERWLAGERGPDAAAEAWRCALGVPRKLLLIQLWRSVLFATVPIAAYLALAFGYSLGEALVVLLAILVTASLPTILGTIGVELYLRPVVREAAEAIEGPLPPHPTVRLRWRLLAVFPLIGITSAMFVAVIAEVPRDAGLAELGVDVVATLVIAGSSTLLLAYMTAGALLAPVEELAAAMSRVAEGDLSARATVSSADELGTLAERFNRMTEELQASRQRLVRAREEERRRLRRDLHDGLGPSLTAISLHLDAASRMIPERPEEARRVVSELSAQSRELMSEVRELVHDLRPPALDTLGLAGAIERTAGRLRGADPDPDLEFELAVDGDAGSLGAAAEVAAYLIAREAIANVVRHSGASRCSVSLRVVRGRLVLEVADDGRGIPDGAPPGVGLHSMRERASELGGSCEVAPGAGRGTIVRAELPA